MNKIKYFETFDNSPHVDDDVLGCGGILDNHVLYCGLDETGQDRPKWKID